MDLRMNRVARAAISALGARAIGGGGHVTLCFAAVALQGLAGVACAQASDAAVAPENKATPDASQAGAQAAKPPASAASAPQGARLDQVVVTARKRAELAQDVPASVSTLGADTMLRENLVTMQDFASRIPGVALNARSGGQTEVVLRGISTGSDANPTTAVTIDDAPFGSSLSAGGGSSNLPDLDPFDLRRVEVLRGPQGTLYGASNLGGLLKYVTVTPDASQLSGRVEVDGASVAHGGNGYGARAAVNVPVVTNEFALRASVVKRRDPGYIDDPRLGRKDVNTLDVEGGRLAAAWFPSSNVTVRASALVQRTQADAAGTVDRDAAFQPIAGDGFYTQRRLAGTGGLDRHLAFRDLNVDVDLDWARLSSITSYGNIDTTTPQDLSIAFAGLLQALGQPNGGVKYDQQVQASKLSQEVRLESPEKRLGLEWRLGLFYTRETAKTSYSIRAVDPTTSAPVAGLPTIIEGGTHSEFHDAAVFGTATYHLDDKADVQVGARQSRNRQNYSEDTAGLLSGGATTTSAATPGENSTTYLITPRYRFSPELMTYATVATGYRPGGPNTVARQNVPPTYASDSTRNYELGVKGDLFDRRFSFAAALYHIDWKNIQLLQADANGLAYFANSAGAKSDGLELQIAWYPLTGLSITGSAAIMRAVLTQDLPPTATGVGAAGDRLPYSPRRSATLSVKQDVGIFDGLKATFGATVSYVGDRLGPFAVANRTRFVLPGFATVDLTAGIANGPWAVNAFVKNAADRQAYLGGPPGSTPLAVTLPPRTLGLSASYSF